MNDTIQFPFYIRFAFILFILISLGGIIYIGQDIIVPLIFSLFFAILLGPVVFLFKDKLHFPNILAISSALLFSIIIILAIVFFISWQVSDIVDDWNTIKTNIIIYFESLQNLMSHYFHLSKNEQAEFINNAKHDSAENGKKIIANTLVSITDVLLNLILVPIYTFLILLYKSHFLKFLTKLYDQKYYPKLKDILCQIKVSVQSYILGLIFEMIAVSILTSIGFWIIGIKYALVLGIITGILNLVPYIGILFAGLLSIIATLTGAADISLIVGVIVVNIIVQLIDNNILVPLIISSKVEINALVSIIGIIIGGAICGISGMFLAIPIIAILKVIFDRMEFLKPWGYLMGDNIPKTYTWNNIKLPNLNSHDK